MKKIILVILLMGVAGLGYRLLNGRVDQSLLRYSMKETSLSFEYDTDTYVLTERLSRVTLMLKEDYESLERGEREGGEGPPAIVFESFEYPYSPQPLVWAETYPQLSNYNLRTGEIRERNVAGFTGIEYQADGLYPNRNVVFGSGNRIYYINGSYLDPDSSLYRDFETIINSVEL